MQFYENYKSIISKSNIAQALKKKRHYINFIQGTACMGLSALIYFANSSNPPFWEIIFATGGIIFFTMNPFHKTLGVTQGIFTKLIHTPESKQALTVYYNQLLNILHERVIPQMEEDRPTTMEYFLNGHQPKERAMNYVMIICESLSRLIHGLETDTLTKQDFFHFEKIYYFSKQSNIIALFEQLNRENENSIYLDKILSLEEPKEKEQKIELAQEVGSTIPVKYRV